MEDAEMTTNRKRALIVGALILLLAAGAAPALRVEASGAPGPPEPPEPPDPPEPPEHESFVFVGDDGIVAFGVGRRGFLGVHIEDVTEEKASELKLAEPHGALVTEVEDGSPAAAAGLKEGDVVVAYQGNRVESAAALMRMVRETPPGREVKIQYSRDGSVRSAEVRLADRGGRRGGRAWSWGPMPPIEIPELHLDKLRIPEIRRHVVVHRPRLGVVIEDLTPQLAEYFGVKEGEGILVTEVLDGYPAEKAGLKAGDVIVRIGGEKIEDASDIRDALEDRGDETVDVTVVRDRAERTIQVKLEKPGREESRDGEDAEMRRELRRALEEARRARRDAAEEYRDAMRKHRDEMRELRRRGTPGGALVAI
jgi:serine protease Do